MQRKLKVLDLFSGTAGFTLGLESVPYYKTHKFCELEEHCFKVISKNFPGIKIERDVRKLKVKPGKYDVMTGGFPCQDISIAGKMNGGINGERSGLWKEYKRIIGEGNPRYVFIENVENLRRKGLEVVLHDLATLGYDAAWTTYDTKYFGLPQRRRRVYIIGCRDGIPAGYDLFKLEERCKKKRADEVRHFNQGFDWDFRSGKKKRKGFAYFTYQRSDQFGTGGLASALLKSDSGIKDIILEGKRLRKVSPRERMLQQGYPIGWLDNCNLTMTQKYSCNGMSIPVIKSLATSVMKMDVRIHAPKGANFYSRGFYRILDKSALGSSIICPNTGKISPSVYTMEFLKAQKDFVGIKRKKQKNKSLRIKHKTKLKIPKH